MASGTSGREGGIWGNRRLEGGDAFQSLLARESRTREFADTARVQRAKCRENDESYGEPIRDCSGRSVVGGDGAQADRVTVALIGGVANSDGGYLRRTTGYMGAFGSGGSAQGQAGGLSERDQS